MAEIWKPVPGYGGHYEASNLGRIRSKERIVMKRHRSGNLIQQRYAGRLLTPCAADDLGHMIVHLGIAGRRVNVAVHRIVLLAFAGEPLPDQEACHKNGVASDNRADNLRWDTHAANNGDRVRHGTYDLGEDHAMAVLTEVDVKAMRASGLGAAAAARKFGISKSQAWRILTGRAWKHTIERLGAGCR